MPAIYGPKTAGAWGDPTPIQGTSLVLYDAYGNRPAAGIAGRLFQASDGGPLWLDTGSVWRPRIDGLLGHQPPAAAGWTSRSHGGIATTLVDEIGALAFIFSNSASAPEEVRIASKAAPSAPYRVEAHLRALWSAAGTQLFGIGFRQSSDGRVELLCATGAAGATMRLTRHRATASNTGAAPSYSFDSESSQNWAFGIADSVWLAITRDAAGNRGFEWSPDGKHWTVLIDMAVATNGFIAPDEVCLTSWVSGGTNAYVQGAIIDSYRETV